MSVSPNLIGLKFGRLTVVSREGIHKSGAIKWRCKCDCGRKATPTTYALQRGLTQGCPYHIRGRLPTAEASLNCLFRSYKNGARVRHLKFTLSKNTFRRLVTSLCHYCGSSGTRSIKRLKGGKEAYPERYVGIDRKDNKVGYLPMNCVPCCTSCNRAKKALGYVEFLKWIDRLANHRLKTQNPAFQPGNV